MGLRKKLFIHPPMLLFINTDMPIIKHSEALIAYKLTAYSRHLPD
jgi:hypothetical protein